jgi:hypothetical protein
VFICVHPRFDFFFAGYDLRAFGKAGMRQRMAGGMEPRIPNRIPVTKPITATPGVMPMVKAPMENGMVMPSSSHNAKTEASKVPAKQATRLSCTKLKKIAKRPKPIA